MITIIKSIRLLALKLNKAKNKNHKNEYKLQIYLTEKGKFRKMKNTDDKVYEFD